MKEVVWFVSDEDKRKIKQEIGEKSNFIFVDSAREFERLIDGDRFLVFSTEKIDDSEALLEIIRSNSRHIFYELFNAKRGKITKILALSRLENNIEQSLWLDEILKIIEEQNSLV